VAGGRGAGGWPRSRVQKRARPASDAAALGKASGQEEERRGYKRGKEPPSSSGRAARAGGPAPAALHRAPCEAGWRPVGAGKERTWGRREAPHRERKARVCLALGRMAAGRRERAKPIVQETRGGRGGRGGLRVQSGRRPRLAAAADSSEGRGPRGCAPRPQAGAAEGAPATTGRRREGRASRAPASSEGRRRPAPQSNGGAGGVQRQSRVPGAPCAPPTHGRPRGRPGEGASSQAATGACALLL
jgi:hypothetical protein